MTEITRKYGIRVRKDQNILGYLYLDNGKVIILDTQDPEDFNAVFSDRDSANLLVYILRKFEGDVYDDTYHFQVEGMAIVEP